MEENINSDRIERELAISPITDSYFINAKDEIKPNNRFKAKYKLFAVGFSDVSTELIVKQFDNSDLVTEITPRAIDASEKETYINIVYRDNSTVLAEIQPYIHNFVEIEIEVRPHNRMVAIYEVQQPPIATDVFNPTQDAFTREKLDYQSINYGGYTSMVVGRSEDDIWRSFLQFDLHSIHPSYILTDAKLRLYYSGTVPDGIDLELFNANKAWSENNITHLNRPTPIELVTDQYTVNKKVGFVEFNVVNIVKDWTSLNQPNNGFIIRVSNETSTGQVIFKTRESSLPPELLIDYYDSRIFSIGKSQHLTEIYIYKRQDSYINTEITVDSVFDFSKQETEIYVHRKEVPLDMDIFTEITVNQPYVNAEMIVAIPLESNKFTEISIRNPRVDKTNAEITINKPIIPAKITVRKSDSNPILTEIIASKPNIPVKITIPSYDDSTIMAVIETNDIHINEVDTVIIVSIDTVKTEITPRVKDEENLYTEITVSKNIIHTEIYVNYSDDIFVEIDANVKSDIDTEIIASIPIIPIELTVQKYDEDIILTEIFSAYTSNIFSEIIVHQVDDIETVIDIKATSNIATRIITSKPIIWSEITVPTWDESTIITTIEPRIFMVNNVQTVIVVNGGVSGYAFIM
ncbi:DNRLRE domain-containing protein [Lysinibacillus sp. CNPSo 3705]|uniref:DNRLRE domain-containing protein n=1 Tax=Lysinibacillus sp. CNPSo 3705 TaxID=3028148 RepID=UPI0023631EA9|nr:DNRLRE domain-containing protein [Lysinibacillus sp. CNPSo 3705]MDD1502597.1 DNRLRE domain-containing protein [Lysinibacillus sp. CNPSo 3705]